MEPFAPGMKLHERVQRAAMTEGLMVYAMPGTIDGDRGNHIMLAPPFTIDAAVVEPLPIGSIARSRPSSRTMSCQRRSA